MNDPAPIAGIIVIDKPEGPTSMQVCARIRGKLRATGAPKRIKVGHGGTLDPLATGVLVVMVGRATKLCEKVMGGTKGYLAEIDLAHRSDTDDREGPVEAVEVAEPPLRAQIEFACARFEGDIQQVPPAFSAMHVGGRRAYQLARAGQAPQLEARTVRIDRCALVGYEWPIATVEIVCGKGTYIRSLARDMGAQLGCGGMLASLRRTAVGPFTLEHSTPLDDLPETMDGSELRPASDFGL